MRASERARARARVCVRALRAHKLCESCCAHSRCALRVVFVCIPLCCVCVFFITVVLCSILFSLFSLIFFVIFPFVCDFVCVGCTRVVCERVCM